MNSLISDSPYLLFEEWLDEARDKQEGEFQALSWMQYNAMTLVSSTPDGHPSARMVLLKGMVQGCFRFFTNYESRKAKELLSNPYAQLLFYWPHLGKQVRIEGKVQKISEQDSDAYFMTRSRGSRIGAIASHQSCPLSSMEELHQRTMEIEKEFEGKEVTRPQNWGGFELDPSHFEFWIDGVDRLHERLVFDRVLSGSEGELGSEQKEGWKISRLWP